MADNTLVTIKFNAVDNFQKTAKEARKLGVALEQIGKLDAKGGGYAVGVGSKENLEKFKDKNLARKGHGGLPVTKMDIGDKESQSALRSLVKGGKVKQIDVDKASKKAYSGFDKIEKDTERAFRDMIRSANGLTKMMNTIRKNMYGITQNLSGKGAAYKMTGKPMPFGVAQDMFSGDPTKLNAEAERGGRYAKSTTGILKSETINKVMSTRKAGKKLPMSAIIKAYGDNENLLKKQVVLQTYLNKSIEHNLEYSKLEEKIRNYKSNKEKNISNVVSNIPHRIMGKSEQGSLIGGFQQQSANIVNDKKIANRSEKHAKTFDQIGNLREKSQKERTKNIQNITKEDTNVAKKNKKFNDDALKKNQIYKDKNIGDVVNKIPHRIMDKSEQSSLISGFQQRGGEFTKTEKLRKDENKGKVKGLKDGINKNKQIAGLFKTMSTLTLMLNMSFLGVYFSFMGLFTMLKGGLSSIFSSVADIGSVISGGAMAQAFMGDMGATGMTNPGAIEGLIDAWKTMQGLQGEYKSTMAQFAASVINDEEFQTAAMSILTALKTVFADPKLKTSIIGVFKTLATNIPLIVGIAGEVINVVTYMLEVFKKHPNLMRIIMYSIVAMPILSILNLLVGMISGFITLWVTFSSWHKASQIAQLAATETGTGLGLIGDIGGGLGGLTLGGLVMLGLKAVAAALVIGVADLIGGIIVGLLIGFVVVGAMVWLELDKKIGDLASDVADMLNQSELGIFLGNILLFVGGYIALFGGPIVGFFIGIRDGLKEGQGPLEAAMSGFSKGLEYFFLAIDTILNASKQIFARVANKMIDGRNAIASTFGMSQIDNINYDDIQKSDFAGWWRNKRAMADADVVGSPKDGDSFTVNIVDNGNGNYETTVDKNDQSLAYHNTAGA